MALDTLQWVIWLLEMVSEHLLAPIISSGEAHTAMGIAATTLENILRLIVVSYLLLPFAFTGNTIVPLTLCGRTLTAMGIKANFAKNILCDIIAIRLIGTFFDAVTCFIYKIFGLYWARFIPAARSRITKKDLKQNVSAIMDHVRHVSTAGVFTLVELTLLPMAICGLVPKLVPGTDREPVIWEDSDPEDDPAEANRPEAPPMPSSECERPSTVLSSPHSDDLDSQSRRQLREENLSLRQDLAHVRECKRKLHRRYRRNNEELLTTQAKVDLHERTLVGVLNRYIALKAAYDLKGQLIDALKDCVGTMRSRPAATTAERTSAERETMEESWTEVQVLAGHA
ncbi:hypothetical protein TI39_contig4134g00012 [Zymoseptoria brevis]|uniref:Uncharacterized protein n=1 Tax=Zymoseptoria brevis TaxID=1047168 RepID=A0A0F4GCQ2_9PEZI|nr:hypothetical protein TI39_contig4134g00012 [Zymoseptoria brevis]